MSEIIQKENLPQASTAFWKQVVFLGIKKWWLVAVPLFSFPVLIIIFGIIIPVYHYQLVPQHDAALTDTTSGSFHSNDKLEKKTYDQLKKIAENEIELVWLENKLSLAKQDSVYGLLSISDSLLSLGIKGVEVHHCHLQSIEISPRLALIHHENLWPWLSKPFELQRYNATIPKTPAVVKYAPKNAGEAAKNNSKPDSTEVLPVYYQLWFDRNLSIAIHQAETTTEADHDILVQYQNSIRAQDTTSLIKLFKERRITEKPMFIRLIMSREDAITLFRAIPKNAKFIIKM